MPISPSTPPQSALAAVQAGTRAVLASRRSGTPALRAADSGALTFDLPVQVFVLGASDLAAGKGLAAARAVGWRYLVRDGGEPLATVDAATGRGGAHTFSHLNEGPFVQATADAVASAGDRPETRGARFEARLLEIPALHSVSLWLHRDDKPDTGVLVPLAPAPPSLESGRPYAPPAFLEIVQQQAAAIGEGEGLSGDRGS